MGDWKCGVGEWQNLITHYIKDRRKESRMNPGLRAQSTVLTGLVTRPEASKTHISEHEFTLNFGSLNFEMPKYHSSLSA